jgi:hypothetical protein
MQVGNNVWRYLKIDRDRREIEIENYGNRRI